MGDCQLHTGGIMLHVTIITGWCRTRTQESAVCQGSESLSRQDQEAGRKDLECGAEAPHSESKPSWRGGHLFQ
jgi:hypothetical protein